MNKLCKKVLLVITSLLAGLMLMTGSAFAAWESGEIILARELSIGEIVTVQIASGTNKDAMVVKEGECPRLVLLENLGADTVYKETGGSESNRAYDISNLKTVIDSRTAGHANYIVNISAPFLHDIAQNEDQNLPALIDTRLTMAGGFWTRSPLSYSYLFYAHPYGVVASTYSQNYSGVRPAFNLKVGTCLKYSSTTGKFSVITSATERAIAFFKLNGFDTVISVPQGQTPAGFSVLPGYTGVFYKEFNGMFLFAGTQDYTTPTNIGSLNIDFPSEMSQATFARNSTKYKRNGSLVSANVPAYETGKFGNGVHIEEATTNLLTANQSSVETDIIGFDTDATGTPTLTRVTTENWTGSASLRIQTNTSGHGIRVSNGIQLAGQYTFTVWLKGTGNAILVIYDGVDVTASEGFFLTSNWTRYSVTRNCANGRIHGYVIQNGSGTMDCYADGMQLEAKAYATSWQIGGTARAADSLYYTLTSALPNEWFMSGVWIPEQDSTIGTNVDLVLNMLYFDETNRYGVGYTAFGDHFYFYKPGDGGRLDASAIVFSADDKIEYGAAQFTQSHGDLVAGMHLWYRINGGPVLHVSNTNTNTHTAPTKLYVGCYPYASYEANGTHDSIKLIDITATEENGTTINNAWAESFLTAASAPAADEATLLLCNFDNNLN